MPDDAPETPEKKPKKTTPRATAAEVDARVSKVFDLILGGAIFGDILQFASESAWNLTDRQLREYISRATTLIREHRERDRDTLVSQHLAMRSRLYAVAVQGGEIASALRILQDQAALEGLYPPQATVAEINVNQKGQPVSDAEVDAAIRRATA